MNHMLWIDLEMTGLDENKHHILEVAAMVTTYGFEIKEEYHRVVFQRPEVLALMDDWCVKTHGESGLTEAVATGTPLSQVESDLIALADRFYKTSDRIVIAGNSINNDRRFIDKYLPQFAKRLHYRLIDVSSFKEVFREKYGVQFKKANTHRALDDIRESIKELQTYLEHVKI